VRVFGYVRVSTIEQESGHGPEVQERAIRAYCKAKGLDEPDIVNESASGESIAGRREFLRILATVRELADGGEQVHVVFRSSDRLARDLMDQESVVATSLQVGFRLHSTLAHEAELFDPANARDPMRTAIRQFFGIFNQLDKAIIKARLDGGLYSKAAQGGSTGGRYPFGYMKFNGEIVPCPEEVPAVQLVFRLRKQGLDLATIAAAAAHDFPQVCSGWVKTSVKRVLDKADLYVRGMYRSRLAAAPMHRPELALVKDGGEEAPARTGGVDWDKIPDPISSHSLAVLLGKPAQELEAEALRRSLLVRWDKTRMMLPRESARALASQN
jgi:DNA invertase Pin-like site-specific DNA recombinase